MIKASVKVSNEESKLIKDFVLYEENIVLSKKDPKIQEIVQDTLSSFKGQVEDVGLTFKMVW